MGGWGVKAGGGRQDNSFLLMEYYSSFFVLLMKKTSCSFSLMKKNQKIKAAKYFGVHTFTPAHAIQLVAPLRGTPQTVLLAAGHRSRLQNNNFNPKCSEAY